MAKYMFQASYAAQGIKGLEKDKASGRKTALANTLESLGGKLEGFYFSFGKEDWVLIADLPDNVSAAAFSMAVSGSDLLRTATTPLVTVDEMEKAFQKKIKFQAPGHFTAG